MANEKNLKPFEDRTESEQREIRKKGGIKSGESRRKAKDIRKQLEIALTMPADPSVAAALGKTGVEIRDNADVVVASIMKGVMKSNPQMIDRLMEYIGQSKKNEQRDAEIELARARVEVEKQRAELEAEKQRMWREAMKSANEDEQEDDGFIEALTGTALNDWSDET